MGASHSFKQHLPLLRSTGSTYVIQRGKNEKMLTENIFGPFGHAWPQQHLSPVRTLQPRWHEWDLLRSFWLKFTGHFLRKLHGAFLHYLPKNRAFLGVNSYLCEYLHVDYADDMSIRQARINLNAHTPLSKTSDNIHYMVEDSVYEALDAEMSTSTMI